MEKEHEYLVKQGRSSFGRMILADYKTNPRFSIGKAKRKPLYIDTDTPGPIYSSSALADLKYKKPPKWKIGDAERPPIYTNERYEYYNHPYNIETDFMALPKKWNKIKGGAITLEPKIKYDFSEKTPGPGRYDPKIDSSRPRMPSYYLGIKTDKNSPLKLETGTGNNVAPWSYNLDNVTKISGHIDSPIYSFQKGKRKPLANKVWTKNESYFVYSSIGNQIMGQKPTMPKESFTRATRESREKCGMFKSMMEKQPTSVRINMPKF